VEFGASLDASTGIRTPDRLARSVVGITTELFRPKHGLNMERNMENGKHYKEINCSSDPLSEEHPRKHLKVFITKQFEIVCV